MRHILASLAILLFATLLSAEHYSHKQITAMTKSREKDFFIWRYLTQDTTTKAHAKKVIGQAHRINSKLRKAYHKKVGQNPPKIVAKKPTAAQIAKWKKNKASGYVAQDNRAFKAIRSGNKKSAAHYLKLALKEAKSAERVDRTNFWLYLVTKKKTYLNPLITSHGINIYTLAARDILNRSYPDTLTPQLKASGSATKELLHPVTWAKIKKKIFSDDEDLEKLAQQYKSKETIGYYTYILSKQNQGKEQYFPMPHRNLLSKLPKSRQAILYAIARQESRFVPGSVSTAYALGMMQIMPFLVRHLAKQRGDKVSYTGQFNPKRSLIYANHHMNYLTKWLRHPLFIAYAYNAGIGFTRKLIRKKHLFRNYGNYEPFLSMESVRNGQANKYGKHVLANYVIYLNKLGEKARITDLLKILHLPKKTDNFRKKRT